MYNESFLNYGINMNFKAVLFGAPRAGKTVIHQKISGVGVSQHYKPTLGADFNTLNIPSHNSVEDIKVVLWDTPSTFNFNAFTALTLSHVDLGIYCIDLSEEITDEIIASIKSDIDKLKSRSPDTQLILVGTKNDCAREQALETARKQFDNVQFSKVISTSSYVNNGLEELYNCLAKGAKDKYLQEKIRLYKENQQVNGILFARNLCNPKSELYLALENLYNCTKELDYQTLTALGNITSDLMFNLLNSQMTDKVAAINSFVQQSEELLQDKYNGIVKGILAVAITAAVTVVAAIIGFGIGFALGAWSGPGAFFTGLLAGSASAVAVVGGSSLVGTGALAYTLYRFFSSSPVVETVNEVAEQAKASTVVAPT